MIDRDDMMSRLDRFIGIESDKVYDADYEINETSDTEDDEDSIPEFYEAEVVGEAFDLNNLEVKASHDMDKRIDSIVKTIEKAETLLENLTHVISERDEARDYEVAATMVKTIVDANKTVMDIHKDIIKLKRGNGKQISIGTLNSTHQTANVTVSSTKDIMKQLKELKRELS